MIAPAALERASGAAAPICHCAPAVVTKVNAIAPTKYLFIFSFLQCMQLAGQLLAATAQASIRHALRNLSPFSS
jgi:hypothetical protein